MKGMLLFHFLFRVIMAHELFGGAGFSWLFTARKFTPFVPVRLQKKPPRGFQNVGGASKQFRRTNPPQRRIDGITGLRAGI
jgi:hypothetical protein